MMLSVDVISDVICPWCFIGKRRLEKAVAALEGQRDVRVRWLPFQLNPQMPKEGISRKDYRTRKFGSWERSLELDAQVAAAGEADGIHFAFDRIERTPNTLDAHRLIWLAEKENCQDAVVEALFQAYFTDGQDISNRQTLLDVVAQAGLNPSKAEIALTSANGQEAVQEADELARRLRLQGVPFFVINDAVTLSGAQPPHAFLTALEQAIGSQ
jgi:Predicted dithiol-disulfide isomerase involved in polyketide biosynthesis